MNVWERSLRDQIDEWCCSVDGFAQDIHCCLRSWEKEAAVEFVEVVVQPYQNEQLSIYDAFCLTEILDWFDTGKLAYCKLPLASGPVMDRYVDTNRKMLLSSCPDSVEAKVWCGHRTCDGSVELKQSMQFKLFDGSVIDVPTGEGFRLEIGATRSSTTRAHLIFGSNLARWPYGHKKLHLWHATECLNQLCDLFLGPGKQS